MSGGHLLVLDRAGREVKQYDLPSGLVTLGSSSSCDIRFLLPTVEPHHATVVVHDKQTVVHNVGGGETLVNGLSVSVAPLAHGDVLAVGGRELRWRYARPAPHRARPTSLTPVLLRMSRVRARVAARRSLAPPTRPPRSPHRNSTPGGVSARQVAVVQPQRRDAVDTTVESVVTNIRRREVSKNEQDISSSSKSEDVKSKSKSPKASQMSLQNTTKATMWIESRKTSPRNVKESPARIAKEVTPRRAVSAKKITPLRMAVLKRAQSAHKMKVTKIEAPLTIDHTKQAAIMLMTGHTPKKRPNIKTSNAKTPSLVLQKQRPVTSARKPGRPRKNTPNESITSSGSASEQTVPSIVTPDAMPQKFLSISDTYSVKDTSLRSPLLPNPKKSALKSSTVKRTTRKTESIKFDLSNLEDGASNSMDIVTVSDAGDHSLDDASRDELSLHYSDSSTGDSPSPRKPIHAGESPSPRRSAQSRSSRILEKTLGTTFEKDKEHEVSPPSLQTANPKKSTRGSMMVHKVLQTPDTSKSYRTTGSLSDQSWETTVASRYKTRTLSPRGSCTVDNKMESYSVIDLVSMESRNSRSMYSSASDASTSKFNTPQSMARRSMRSLGAHCLLASSTPAAAADVIVPRLPRSQSATTSRSYDSFQSSSCQIVSRRSKSLANSSLSTPQNATFNISEREKCRSPLDLENIPEVTLNSTRNTRHRNTPPDHGKENVTYEKDITQSFSTPKNTGDTSNVSDKSRKTKSLSTSKNSSRNITLNITGNSRSSKSKRARVSDDEMSSVSVASSPIRSRSLKSTSAQSPPPNGMSTPENQNSPEEVATPMLSIQSLLESSRNISKPRQTRRNMARIPTARKTTGSRMSPLHKQASVKSISFTFGTTVSTRSRRNSKKEGISPNANADLSQDDGDMTPKKSVKLVQEAVKNKHSTAKRPKSIRSVIDNLNDSDIVQQLFNSPVKRKLSQSMIEFSKKQLMDDETTPPRKATRNTIALTGITTNESSMEQSPAITPEVFVSPLTAGGSNKRNVALKLQQWRERTTETNDLHETVGNRSTHTPRQTHRRSVKNDLTKVSGIKSLFARSPRNRLTDVRIKELFAASPRNDLRRVPKLRLIFQESPKDDLRDVSGVRELFKKRSPRNDLRNISGVKTTMRRHSPRNDLDDVRGVRHQFRREKHDDLNNVSGIEELFNELHHVTDLADANAETPFDLLMSRPTPVVRAYPKAKSFTTKLIRKPKTRRAQSLQSSFTLINNNVEDWLENELRKRMHKDSPREQRVKSNMSTRNSGPTPKNNLNNSKTKSNVSRELLKLATHTVEGNSPLPTSRVRNSTLTKTSLNDMVELKRSASEIYGAHMLPIKKRSLVETSRNRSSHKNSLPIKKRMVKHSTPMKSSHIATDNITMNVSDIGRMSPIPPYDAAYLNANTIIPIEEPKGRLKRKLVQTKKANAIPAADIVNNINISASKEHSSKNKENIASPVQVRSTRNRKTNVEQNNVKKRRSSIVVKKKAPGLSPKPARKVKPGTVNTEPKARPTTRRKLNQEQGPRKSDTENEENLNKMNKNNKGRSSNAHKGEVLEKHKDSPPTTRTTRRHKASVDKVQTPKKMPRAKVLKLTVVVTKPSPNLKTRITNQSKIKGNKSPMKNLQRTRKAKAEAKNTDKLEEPSPEVEDEARNEIKTRGGRRGKGASLAIKETESGKVTSKNNSKSNLRGNNKDLNIDPKPRRERKTIAQNNIQDDKKATEVNKRSTRNTVNVNRKTRGKTAVSQETIEPPKRRITIKESSEEIGRNNKRKTTDKESPSKLRAGDKVTNRTNRGRNNEETAKTNQRITKGRQGKANDAIIEKTIAGEVTETRRGRPRKTTKEESSEKPVEPKATRSTNTTKQPLSGKASGAAKSEVETKRISKTEAKQKILKAAGRNVKTNITEKTVETQQPLAAGRKRKADADPSIAKAGPSPPKTRRTAAASPKLTRARAAAQQSAAQQSAAQQSAARTRRR